VVLRGVHVPVFLLAIAGVFICLGCGKIKGPDFGYMESPRAIVATPASPASGDVTIIYQLIDRELELGTIALEYSTDNGQTFNSCTLVNPGAATNLESAWHPGKTHSVQWNSVADNLALSGDATVCVKITPSDVSNPSGTVGISGSFTLNNTAYNQPPTATAATPAGVQSGNVQINYFLADVESDTCSIAVLYSINDGTSWQAATMGTAGNGLTGLSSSPAGTAHVFFWDSRADNVALSGQIDTIKVRIIPTDFNAGTAGDTTSFSVDNSIVNELPTVAITSGPTHGSTVTTTQVTFGWSGSDTDGSVIGYYYSFDHDPPDIWTTDISVTSGALSEDSHIFRVVAMDDDNDLSAVASRTFTVSITGTITVNFTGSPLSGDAPLTVDFTDLSTATNGITSWDWDFGDSGTSTAQNPQHIYLGEGNFTVSLTVTGPDGTDTETKTNYITVSGTPTGDTIHVDGTNGNDGWNGLTWGTAVKTIQTGLDKASDNWTVLVADGTYTGASNRGLTFGGKAIQLKSVGGADACIIDCENSARGFGFLDDETNATIVEGFTIKNGKDGAIYCYQASPTIANCIIADSTNNNYGGGMDFSGGNLVITNCIFTNNTAERGGAIFCSFSNPTITNCAFIDNTATSWDGGGIYCQDSILTINNCTIANNTATESGAGIASHGSTCTLNNTIIWGNVASTTGHQIYTDTFDADVTLDCCDFANGNGDVAGSGTVTEQGVCINLDPMFENATSQNYRLQAGSPCIDAGDNMLVPPGITADLDGNMRIFDGDGDTTATVDIGVYEYGSSSPPPEYCWTHRAGGSDADEAHAVCVDGSGNVYMAGFFGNTVDFAEDWGASDPKTGPAGFIVKVDANGDYCWTRTLGDRICGACTDASSNVYVTGYFYGTVNFAQAWGANDSHTSSGGADIFLTKIDASGDYCWTHRMGGLDTDLTTAVSTDTDGNVYVVGYFFGTVDFAADWGGNDEKTSVAYNDAFVTKIGPDGGYCWTHVMGGTDMDEASDVVADPAGNVYVTGIFDNTVNFDADWALTDEKTTAGYEDIFVTKIDPSGSYCWTRRMGGNDRFDEPWSMCTDTVGNIYVVGSFQSSSVDFAEDWGGSDPKTNAGSPDGFVTKIDYEGNYCWTRRIGASSPDNVCDICTDTNGNVYLQGYFHATVNFAADWGGNDSKQASGAPDMFVTKIDAAGEYCWTYRIAVWHGIASGGAICTDKFQNLYLVGPYAYTLNFPEDWGGTDEKTSAGATDTYIAKLKP
jgi:predicted outer membrane repeat protein